MAKKKKGLNPDAKGLIFIVSGLLLLLSLCSFSSQEMHHNWLGFIGHVIAFGGNYFFGLAAYTIPFYFAITGIRILKNQKPIPKQEHLIFAILLISLSMLFTVFADSYPKQASFFKNKVISETIVLDIPYSRTLSRNYLGGIPCYFLFADVPVVNLERIVTPLGTTLIFLSLGLICFLQMTSITIFTLFSSIVGKLQALFHRKPVPLPPKKEFSGWEPTEPPEPKKKLSEIVKPTIAPLPKIKSISQPKEKEMPLMLPVVFKDGSYQLPPTSLLNTLSQKIDQPTLKKDLKQQANVLEETLRSFSIEAKVGEVHSGPTITSFEVHPSIGVKVQKIKALENDIALNMQAKSIRIVAPIPGKAAVGVEVPALHPQDVSFKEMLLYYTQKSKKMAIPVLLGKAINGDWVFSDLARMPHCLIAGATGSGKSVCINTIVMSILMTAHPDEVKLLMVDPKKVELTQYSQLPHMIAPVITEPHGAYAALQWLVKEMQVRYEILKQLGLRNITAFNSRKVNKELEASLNIPIPEQMPFIVALIDEFADLMMVSSADIETPIARIAQMARAVGIHLILATQRPSREVITGIIKANIPTRISFKVASRINSQIILDDTGAESLLGNGDLLFLPPGSAQLVRAQGAYISDEEINKVIDSICKQKAPNYLIPSFDSFRSLEQASDAPKGKDALYEQALAIVVASKSASTTFLQRKLKVGYARAASLMDELEENGIIGPADGAKPRRVIRSGGATPYFDEESSEQE